MNYVDAFYAILNGSYQTSGRNIGPLKCRKVNHRILQPPRQDRYGRNVTDEFRVFQAVEVRRRAGDQRDELVAISDMSGKIFLKYNRAWGMLGNATGPTCTRWDRILATDYAEQGTAEYRGEEWFCYQYKKSPILEIYNLKVAQAVTFKDYLITKYGERT